MCMRKCENVYVCVCVRIRVCTITRDAYVWREIVVLGQRVNWVDTVHIWAPHQLSLPRRFFLVYPRLNQKRNGKLKSNFNQKRSSNLKSVTYHYTEHRTIQQSHTSVHIHIYIHIYICIPCFRHTDADTRMYLHMYAVPCFQVYIFAHEREQIRRVYSTSKKERMQIHTRRGQWRHTHAPHRGATWFI